MTVQLGHGWIQAIDLETRKPISLREDKIVAVCRAPPKGGTRMSLDHGCTLDVCSSPEMWRIEIAIAHRWRDDRCPTGCRACNDSPDSPISPAKAPNLDKPYRGEIANWQRCKCTDRKGLGYYIFGTFLNHPDFGSKRTNTSWVVAHDEFTGQIETNNSRYILVGEEQK